MNDVQPVATTYLALGVQYSSIVNKRCQWSLLARCCSGSGDVMYEEQMYLESQSGTARLDKFTHSLLVKSNVEVSPFLLKGQEPPVCASDVMNFELLNIFY